MQVDLFSTLRDSLVLPADDADQAYIVANLEGTGFQPYALHPYELDALEMLMDDPYEGVVEEAKANQEDWLEENAERYGIPRKDEEAICVTLNGPHDDHATACEGS